MSKESRVTLVLTEPQAQMALRAINYALGSEARDCWIGNNRAEVKRADEARDKLAERLGDIARRAIIAGRKS